MVISCVCTYQHHLFPAYQNEANGPRNNHPLGVVVTLDPNPDNSYLDGKLGKDASGHIVYEPRDAHKGDAARAMMYMMLCYNGEGGYDWTLGHLNTVTLPALSEGPEPEALLKAWSAADPPSLASELTNHVTAFAAGTTTSMTVPLTWTDAAAGTVAPTGYLIMANFSAVKKMMLQK
ncbi:MAG TPA: endonuclease [Bacteroidota bacterium]|nr:endonuclease [Bacteroidota bacterium]